MLEQSTVKMTTNEAALLGTQGHDHPLGYRHLHPLGDAPQRDRGHHLGGSSSVGGAHAESWPALPLPLPLPLQVTSPFAPTWSTHGA